MMTLLRFFLRKLTFCIQIKRCLKIFDLVIWISVMDLTQTTHLLKSRYSSNPRGRKPRNPCDMLRSLLLMHKLQYTSVDKWVHALKTITLYAVLSGFEPDSTPGVGTFYDFFNRLWCTFFTFDESKEKKD